MLSPKHFLSVVVPVYKQEKTIKQDLLNILKTLSQIRYAYEVIVVVDGTSVDFSYDKAKSLKNKNLKVFGYPKNKGKGYAVRFGMRKSRGDYVAFLDSGMEIDPNGVSMLIEHLEWYRADIVVASKRHPASQVSYPPTRRLISFGAQIFARVFLGLKVRDTQAGLKIFKRQVLEKVLPKLLVKRYAFDLEMLAVASHLGYSRIYESPIRLKYNFQDLTHASDLITIYNSLIDAMAVVYRLRIKKYYD